MPANSKVANGPAGTFKPAESQSNTVAANRDQGIRAGDTLAQGKVVHYVRPTYPKALRQRGVHGVVGIRVLVGKNGVPKHLTVVGGPKELVPYAVSAVKQWRYKPGVLNGSRVQFIYDARISFTLSQ